MAIVLTQNYQLVSSFDLTYGSIRLYAKYNSQDNINNYTSYNLKMVYYKSAGTLSFYSADANLDGSTRSYDYTTFYAGETTILEVQRTLQHNNDGSSPVKNVGYSWSASFGGSGSSNVDIQMPNIARLPVITEATDFTDEENPRIAFTNPAGFYIRMYVIRPGYFNFYRNNVTSPYTFQFTQEELNTLRRYTNDASSVSVRLELQAFSSPNYTTESIIGSVRRNVTLTIVNANPDAYLTLTERNQKVIDIYGTEAFTIVKNASQIRMTASYTLKKQATLKSIGFNYNGKTETKTDGTTQITGIVPTSNQFSILVTDSRNLTKSASPTVQPVLENYIPAKINSYEFKRENSTSSNIRLNAEFNYYQHTYNATPNAPTIQYKVGENGTLRTLSSSDYTIDTTNNLITVSNLLLQDTVVYTQSEKLFLYISDIFTEDAENFELLKGIPTFDAGETDFNVNGTLTVCDENGQNKKRILSALEIYPVGSIYINTVNTNPSTFLGGTWVSFGTGRTLVGVDTSQTEFNTVEKTGGEKINSNIRCGGSNYGLNSGGGGYSDRTLIRYPKISDVHEEISAQISNLQPYITCYMWKRTA